jgi:hypothetical protein
MTSWMVRSNINMKKYLFAEMSTNQELRNELKELLALNGALQSDVKAFVPPVESTMKIFNTLGYTAPLAAAVTAATVADQCRFFRSNKLILCKSRYVYRWLYPCTAQRSSHHGNFFGCALRHRHNTIFFRYAICAIVCYGIETTHNADTITYQYRKKYQYCRNRYAQYGQRDGALCLSIIANTASIRQIRQPQQLANQTSAQCLRSKHPIYKTRAAQAESDDSHQHKNPPLSPQRKHWLIHQHNRPQASWGNITRSARQ